MSDNIIVKTDVMRKIAESFGVPACAELTAGVIHDTWDSIEKSDLIIVQEDPDDEFSPVRYSLKQWPNSIVRVKVLVGGWLIQSIEQGRDPVDAAVACDGDDAIVYGNIAIAAIVLREITRRMRAASAN